MHEIISLNDKAEELIANADGIVYFYNVAQRSSYDGIQTIHDHVQKIKATSIASSLTFPRILIGAILAGTEQEVFSNEGIGLAQNLRCEYFQISEKN